MVDEGRETTGLWWYVGRRTYGEIPKPPDMDKQMHEAAIQAFLNWLATYGATAASKSDGDTLAKDE